jgi:hypothetical protein
MNFSRLGLILIALGAISLALFFATPIPDLTFVNLGFLSILSGAMFVLLGFLRRHTIAGNYGTSLVLTGWTFLAAGLFLALAAFLLLSQTLCMETCNLVGFYVPMYAGLVVATAGLGMIVYGKLSMP